MPSKMERISFNWNVVQIYPRYIATACKFIGKRLTEKAYFHVSSENNHISKAVHFPDQFGLPTPTPIIWGLKCGGIPKRVGKTWRGG